LILKRKGIKKLSGLDISPDLLKDAKKLVPSAKFYLSSGEKLPFKANSFDAVLVDSVFHHFMRYDKVLSEIKRVLALGGRLCFIEPHRSFLRDFYDWASTSWFAEFIPPLKRRGISYKGEIKFMRHWLRTEESFYRELRKLGFKEKLKRSDILSIIGTYEVSKKQ